MAAIHSHSTRRNLLEIAALLMAAHKAKRFKTVLIRCRKGILVGNDGYYLSIDEMQIGCVVFIGREYDLTLLKSVVRDN